MIEFDNVSFSYPNQKTNGLKNVSLTINDGECVLLCGRSGCGKTTVTRLINGLIPYFFDGKLEGNVNVNGLKINGTPMYKIAATVGSVFQNPKTQFFNVDADSEIAFGIENQALPHEYLEKRVETTASDLNINELRKRNIFKLSGGEKQKIAFASVYAMNPDIYLLDEPSSNLDIKSIEELHEHLQLIKRQGKTIVIAEHRLYYLIDLVDKICYFENGELFDIYTPEKLMRLSEDRRMAMGLRALDLSKVLPKEMDFDTSEPIFELRNVSLKYSKQTIIEEINLQAAPGEVIAITGDNGAGKTTFSRALCGLHKDFVGEFLWHQKPMNIKKRLKHSYMVMQDVNYQLFAESVEAECSFGIKNPDLALVQETMEELELYDYRYRHPNTLSGGQKQRTAVAVSMICRKDILIFDEPTSGLDFDSMVQVAKLIKRLAKMNKIIFIVTHDYEFLSRTCTRLLNFKNKRLLKGVTEIEHQKV